LFPFRSHLLRPTWSHLLSARSVSNSSRRLRQLAQLAGGKISSAADMVGSYDCSHASAADMVGSCDCSHASTRFHHETAQQSSARSAPIGSVSHVEMWYIWGGTFCGGNFGSAHVDAFLLLLRSQKGQNGQIRANSLHLGRTALSHRRWRFS